MKKFTVLALLLALFSTWVQAQTYNVTVSGRVTEIGTGNAIPNQPVDILLDSSAFFGWGYSNVVLTDANGDYQDVVAVPMSVSQGTGSTGTRDCTPMGYNVNNFAFSSGSTTITGLDFQICTSTSNCTAGFTYNWTMGTTLVQFTDGSSTTTGSIVSWAWDFGDGNTSTQQNPTHAYNSMGNFQVCLTITTSTGCSNTYCTTVNVGGVSCSSTLSASVAPAGVTTFVATGTSSTATPVSYSWDFGDGNTLVGTNSTEVHTYATNGTYIACVDILFSDSCMSRSCATVTVGSAFSCQAGFYWYPDTTGQYSIIVVNTSSGQNLSYSWTFGDGGTSTQAYPQHTYAGPGTYVVCVTVSDNNGCTDTYCDSLVVVNKVNAPFTINVVASGATSVTPVQPVGMSVDLYPNPAHTFLQMDVTLEAAAPVSVALFDLSGRAVTAQDMGELNSGKHGIRLNTNDLPAGLYLARVSAGNSITSHKVMIVH
jgi:PKD repeat protein